MEEIHVRAERAALQGRLQQLVDAYLLSLRRHLAKSRIDQLVLLLRNASQEKRRARKPVRHEERRRVFEPGVLLLDFRSQIL